MNPDNRMEDARRRMELRPPVVLEYEGQLNDDPNQRAEYPLMMYKATETKRYEVLPGAEGFEDIKVADKQRIINSYEGLLCDTLIANSATEAEALAEQGWDVSPKAAHGIVEGMVAATSAKDAEIAMLREQLRQSLAGATDYDPIPPLTPAGNEVTEQGVRPPEKRGPGRPRSVNNDA